MTEQKYTSKQHASNNVRVLDATIDAIQPCLLNNDWLLFYKQDLIEGIVANIWLDQWAEHMLNARYLA
jgi:hypothetical protein